MTPERAVSTTFAMIKPDAVRHRNVGAILSTIEALGFEVVVMRMEWLSQNLVQRLYQEHLGKPFYAQMETFTLSGPVVLLALRYPGDAVACWRRAIGHANPSHAARGSLRHRFGRGMPDNAVHGSADTESALRELKLFFGELNVDLV